MKWIVLTALLALSWVFTSCGSDALGDGEGNNQQDKQNAIHFPTVAFTVPMAATEYDDSTGDIEEEKKGTYPDLMDRWLMSAKNAMAQTETVVARINGQLTAHGDFRLDEVTGTYQTSVDEAFVEELVLCHADQPYLHLKWTAGFSRVVATRNLGIAPYSTFTPYDVIVEMDLRMGAAGTKTLEFFASGKPSFVPDEVKEDLGDDPYLGQYVRLGYNVESKLEFKGVNAWMDQPPTSETTWAGNGDSYVTGFIDGEEGRYVGTSVFKDLCSFQEPLSSTGEGYCWEKAIKYGNKPGESNFINSKWDSSYIAVGVADDASIKTVSLDHVKCPE